MRTSIRSRLFLIIYGIILAFIVGLILLNNIFLEGFYTNHRERTLVSAFSDIATVDLDDSDLETIALEIENSYNIDIQILKQTQSVTEIPEGQNSSFPPFEVPYERIYGDEFAIRDGVIAAVMRKFSGLSSAGTADGFETVEVSDDTTFVAYLTEIVRAFGDVAPEEPRMLALCVGQEQSDGFYIYYILTVSIQSIRDSIDIFNAFTVMIGALFMILAGIIVFVFSNRFTRPILQMNEVTQDLASQNFSKRVETRTRDELGDLGHSINRMSEQLESSIRDLQRANQKLGEDIELKTKIDTMRKEFIANASHELKTPISLILGYSEALKLPGLAQMTVDEYLNIIIDESNKMNKLVMALLKISQLESGFQQINIDRFPLRDLIDETTKLFSIKFIEKNVHVEIDIDDVEIETDFDAIQTVLTNYLSNALNHVDAENLIRVSAKPIDGGRIRIEVFNSGKPIPAESIERIWESFYKIDKARTRAYGGQGLGLSIVRTILTNLGCPFGVENRTDGVAFHFDLTIAGN